MTTLSFHANGKLLLSGEYFVLDGAKAIGLPCRYGQSLKITSSEPTGLINWKSKNADGEIWFEGVFRKADFSIITSSDQRVSAVLQNILKEARLLNPDFLKEKFTLNIETILDFPRLWGLGTSSTLLYTIAEWSAVDPFQLSKNTLGGSGYDIACAGANSPILYQIKKQQSLVKQVNFNPAFKGNLYFIYLSKKQNSREGIKRYRTKTKNNNLLIDKISTLTEAFLNAQTLSDFQKIILEHEGIISDTIELPRAQDLYFSDFDGAIKSLGAWGGDFVLAATQLDAVKAKDYFNKKGFEVFLKYEEMVRWRESI